MIDKVENNSDVLHSLYWPKLVVPGLVTIKWNNTYESNVWTFGHLTKLGYYYYILLLYFICYNDVIY